MCFIESPVAHANSVEPDLTPRSAVSDLSLHYLPITLLGFSRLKWVNEIGQRNTGTNILSPSTIPLYRMKLK